TSIRAFSSESTTCTLGGGRRPTLTDARERGLDQVGTGEARLLVQRLADRGRRLSRREAERDQGADRFFRGPSFRPRAGRGQREVLELVGQLQGKALGLLRAQAGDLPQRRNVFLHDRTDQALR